MVTTKPGSYAGVQPSVRRGRGRGRGGRARQGWATQPTWPLSYWTITTILVTFQCGHVAVVVENIDGIFLLNLSLNTYYELRTRYRCGCVTCVGSYLPFWSWDFPNRGFSICMSSSPTNLTLFRSQWKVCPKNSLLSIPVKRLSREQQKDHKTGKFSPYFQSFQSSSCLTLRDIWGTWNPKTFTVIKPHTKLPFNKTVKMTNGEPKSVFVRSVYLRGSPKSILGNSPSHFRALGACFWSGHVASSLWSNVWNVSDSGIAP